jgi:hypothetical protein
MANPDAAMEYVKQRDGIINTRWKSAACAWRSTP